MTVMVEGIDITEDDQLVAVCRKDKTKQRIALAELPLPSRSRNGPSGALHIVLADRQDSMSTKARKRIRAQYARRDTSLRGDVQGGTGRIWTDVVGSQS